MEMEEAAELFKRQVVSKRPRRQAELLERMLNKTQLSTQRLAHTRLLAIGDEVMRAMTSTNTDEVELEVQARLERQRERSARELQFALQRQQHQLGHKHQQAMERQKKYYETTAERVARQRDALEEQRLSDLRRDLEAEHADHMEKAKAAWEEEKQEALREADARLRKYYTEEMERQKKAELARLMDTAEARFKASLEENIRRTRQQCQAGEARRAQEAATRHAQEMATLTTKMNLVVEEYKKERKHCLKVEKDFRDLQDDYKCFIDVTDGKATHGKFHSDYMMLLRSHGFKIANRKLSTVLHEDISQLDVSTGQEAQDLVAKAMVARRAQSAYR